MKTQPTNAEVEAAIPILCPHYHHAMTSLREVMAWSEQGFSGATLQDLERIASDDTPEQQLAKIRRRAARNAKKLIRLN